MWLPLAEVMAMVFHEAGTSPAINHYLFNPNRQYVHLTCQSGPTGDSQHRKLAFKPTVRGRSNDLEVRRPSQKSA